MFCVYCRDGIDNKSGRISIQWGICSNHLVESRKTSPPSEKCECPSDPPVHPSWVLCMADFVVSLFCSFMWISKVSVVDVRDWFAFTLFGEFSVLEFCERIWDPHLSKTVRSVGSTGRAQCVYVKHSFGRVGGWSFMFGFLPIASVGSWMSRRFTLFGFTDCCKRRFLLWHFWKMFRRSCFLIYFQEMQFNTVWLPVLCCLSQTLLLFKDLSVAWVETNWKQVERGVHVTGSHTIFIFRRSLGYQRISGSLGAFHLPIKIGRSIDGEWAALWSGL